MNLPELVESVCDTLAPAAIDKDVELHLFIDPLVPDHLWFDATRLRQVLYNLAGNAIKFSGGQTRRRGRVAIRVEMSREPVPRLQLSIADNGIGMTPETLSQLFSSFRQAEASTTRRFGGTGLGLAICKRLVDLMGGEVAVQSVVDEGSIFTVSLLADPVSGSRARTYPDLSDIDCIIVGVGAEADDLGVYLNHAHARVQQAADLQAAARQAEGLHRPIVVIQNTRRDNTAAELLHAAFASRPDIHHLLIARGRRRRVRMAGSNGVTLDGNGLRRSAFLHAVAVAAGRESPEVLREDGNDDFLAVAAQPMTVADARAQGRLILIAEDDEVNQKVILRQIEMLGYAAEVAHDGVEALRLWRAGHYGLLLTDLHMPDMDGYTLAASIRQGESERGIAWHDARMPILALTANALRGEEMRAKAAGMDAYLTKPLLLNLLREALAKWLPPDHGDSMPGELFDEAGNRRSSDVFDVTVLEGLVGADREVVNEFLRDYQASVERLAAEMRAAYAVDDVRQIGAIAHKLRASSRSVGALALGDVCAELENACRTGKQEGIDDGAAHFEAALIDVQQQIGSYLLER